MPLMPPALLLLPLLEGLSSPPVSPPPLLTRTRAKRNFPLRQRLKMPNDQHSLPQMLRPLVLVDLSPLLKPIFLHPMCPLRLLLSRPLMPLVLLPALVR